MLSLTFGQAGTPQRLRQYEARTAPPKGNVAERRQVTVMFSDLVGSTALSARMDPEDFAMLFPPTKSASQRLCSASAAL